MKAREKLFSLDESYRYCQKVARRHARNFYYAFFLLPEEEKKAFVAIYAFMRFCDDLADTIPHSPHLSFGEGSGLDVLSSSSATPSALLDSWQEHLEKALEGKSADHPILPAFSETVRKYAIPAEYFFELLEGARMDLAKTRYATFQELREYCYKVAGVVGLVCLRLFEVPLTRQVEEWGVSLGLAFQLTNILRDIKEDAGRGRIYIPLEDLQRFGCAEEDLLHPEALKRLSGGLSRERVGDLEDLEDLEDPAKGGAATGGAAAGGAAEGGAGDRFCSLMKFQVRRAKEFYLKAWPLLGALRGASRASLFTMARIYLGILKKIEEKEYQVFSFRAGLSFLEKAGVVLQSYLLQGNGGAGVPAFLLEGSHGSLQGSHGASGGALESGGSMESQERLPGREA